MPGPHKGLCVWRVGGAGCQVSGVGCRVPMAGEPEAVCATIGFRRMDARAELGVRLCCGEAGTLGCGP